MDISVFPRHHGTLPGNIYYKDLDSVNKDIITKHLKIAGQIQMWWDINSWLIDQIHHKKSVKKRVKYIPSSEDTRYYYENYLYKGRNNISSIDIFPCSFSSYLEDVLVKELKTKNFNYMSVYYSHDDKPEELKFSDFDKNEWLLSEETGMTKNDTFVMERYKTFFIDFIDNCISILKSYENIVNFSKKYNKVKKERDRIVNVMNTPYIIL